MKKDNIYCKLNILLFANSVIILIFRIFSYLLTRKEQFSYSIVLDIVCFAFYATLFILVALRHRIKQNKTDHSMGKFEKAVMLIISITVLIGMIVAVGMIACAIWKTLSYK